MDGVGDLSDHVVKVVIRDKEEIACASFDGPFGESEVHVIGVLQEEVHNVHAALHKRGTGCGLVNDLVVIGVDRQEGDGTFPVLRQVHGVVGDVRWHESQRDGNPVPLVWNSGESGSESGLESGSKGDNELTQRCFEENG